MLNRRINSWRASIACAGFIRLSSFSRRSRSIDARSRTSWLRAFHFEYLPAPMPSASSADTIQTVMSVAVTRSIVTKNERQWNVFFSGENSTQGALLLSTRRSYDRAVNLTFPRRGGTFLP